jgi:hypothetical protein
MADVAYEHEMLNTAASRIADLAARLHRARAAGDEQGEGEFGVERNAWVEVLLLHLRNLTDFYLSNPKKDDVTANHYVSDWTRRDGGEDLEWLAEMSRSLNKRIAHITAYRRRVSKDVDSRLVEDIRLHVRAVFDRWRDRLTPEQTSWFRVIEDGPAQ